MKKFVGSLTKRGTMFISLVSLVIALVIFLIIYSFFVVPSRIKNLKDSATSEIISLREQLQKAKGSIDPKKQKEQKVVQNEEQYKYGPQPTGDYPQDKLNRDTSGYIADAQYEIENSQYDEAEKSLSKAFNSLNQNSPSSFRKKINFLNGKLGALRLEQKIARDKIEKETLKEME